MQLCYFRVPAVAICMHFGLAEAWAGEVAIVSIEAAAADLKVGDEFLFSATVLDTSGAQVSNADIEWESTNTSVAAFAEASKLRAVGTGATTIVARVDGIRDTVSLRVSPEPLPPTSEQLIQAAKNRGELDSNTALLYRLLAAFGDPRLPSTYHGHDEPLLGDNIVLDVAAQMPEMPSDIRSVAAPFFLPPIYDESWFGRVDAGADDQDAKEENPDPSCSLNPKEWASVRLCPLGDGHLCVKIWAEKIDTESMNAMANLSKETATSWEALSEYMGKEPLSDAANECKGLDGDFDIYVSSRFKIPAFSALAKEVDDVLTPDPGHIVFPSSEDPHVIAHELMHAISANYPRCVQEGCDYDWWSDATAEWAVDYVYGPTPNIEHAYAERFLADTNVPLHDEDPMHAYYAYLFPFFLHHQYSDDKIIRKVWESAASMGSLDAIDAALSGNFDAEWRKFAVFNYNLATHIHQSHPQAPYPDWDELYFGASQMQADIPITLNGDSSATHRLQVDVEPMAAQYFRFVFDDPSVRSAVFYNTIPDDEHYAVQALVGNRSGTWELKDWSNGGGSNGAAFCLDRLGDAVREFVLIVSNSDWEERLPLFTSDPPIVAWNNITCRAWNGTVHVRHTQPMRPGKIVEEGTGSFSLESIPQPEPVSGLGSLVTTFLPIMGQMSYKLSSVGTTCIFSAGPVELPLAISGEMLVNNLGSADVKEPIGLGAVPRSYTGTLASDDQFITMTIQCPEGTSSMPWAAGFRVLDAQLGEHFKVSRNGSIQGAFSITAPDDGSTWETNWSMVPGD